jgi:hypothetical protein
VGWGLVMSLAQEMVMVVEVQMGWGLVESLVEKGQIQMMTQ